MGWITENICSFLTDVIGSTIDFFGVLINNMFLAIVQLNNANGYVRRANNYTVALALALVALMVAKQVLTGYIMETDHDPDADPFNLLVRTAQTVAIISCSGWMFDYLLNLSKKVANDLIVSTSVNGVTGEIERLLKVEPLQLGNTFLCYIVMIVLIVIAHIAFTLVSGFRGCELLAMKLLQPIFALDLLTTSRERWNNFFMGYMIAFFSYGLQILFFNIALKSLMSCSFTRPVYMVSTLGWMIMAVKSPKFLEKYLYTTGVSKAASGGLRMVAQVAMFKTM